MVRLVPRRIDRYIFLLFARVFVLCFISLTGVYILGDFVNNANEFVDYSKEKGGMWSLLSIYYGARVPFFFELVGRVAALIATVFTITWLQRHNEMTALMAAGVSRWRIIKPLLVGVIGVSLLGTVNREAVLPRFKNQLSRKAKDLGGGARQPIQPRYDQQTNILISGESITARAMQINSPRFFLPLKWSRFGREIAATKAVRKPATKNHPAGYQMIGVTLPKEISRQASITDDQHPVILTPRDHPWLPADECFVASDISLAQLSDTRAWSQYSSTKNLIRAMRNPSLDLGNNIPVAIHSRLLQPFLDLTLFFLGVPMVLARESRNVFVAIGSCMLMVVAFYLIVVVFQNLGTNYIVPPSLAAWAPLMIIVPWAAYISDPFRR
jgi:lipopolysaccharide export system permease protein